MRTELIEAASRDEAEVRVPWADYIVEVEDGYMAFESRADYEVWASTR